MKLVRFLSKLNTEPVTIELKNGTVITGTVLKGAVEEASHVEVLPSKLDAKVRTIQVHELPTNKAVAGQRVAMNLSNISLDDIKPGDVFVITQAAV